MPQEMIDRCTNVIWSCKTEDQFLNAIKYLELAAKKHGLIDPLDAIKLIEAHAVQRYRLLCFVDTSNGVKHG